MAGTKIFDLGALGAQPAETDVVALVDVSDNSQSADGSTKKVVFSNLQKPYAKPEMTTGVYYISDTHVFGTVTGLTSLTLNTMYSNPILIPSTITVDRIGIYNNSALAGKDARLGIYNDSSGRPGSLLLDAGVVDFDATGEKEIVISQELTPGWYWPVILPEATGNIRGTSTTSNYGILGKDTITSTTLYTHASNAQAFGALPDPFGVATMLKTNNPLLHLRIG